LGASNLNDRPRVRFSLRWKIVIPFMFLALAIGLAATFFVNRLLNETVEIRFLRQLATSGQQATDAVVRSESRLLEVERLIANTEGIAQALDASDSEELRALALPVVVNAGVDVVAIVDTNGVSLLAARRRPQAPPGEYETLRDETYYADWDFVQAALSGESDPDIGDKQAGLEAIRLDDQSVPTFFVAAPVVDTAGHLYGAVLVGSYLDTMVVAMREQAGASISVYDSNDGALLGSTLEPEAVESLTIPPELVLATFDPAQTASPVRTIQVAGSTYREVLTPLVARSETETLGILGVSLLEIPLQTSITSNGLLVVGLGVAAMFLIVITGVVVSDSITRPLVTMADASAQVAVGNLNTYVPETGEDELGLLAKTFNRMVDGLREGSIYHELLDRTVTPEVRDELRRTLTDSGVMMRGRSAKATILSGTFHGFSELTEHFSPADVMVTLNEYFSGLSPIVTRYGGVMDKFDGEELMAFFGILPQPLPPQVSAFKATHAGVEMLEFVHDLNEKRIKRGLPALELGIGVASGSVIAGGLGSRQRLHYTVVGDPVTTAQRIHEITQEMSRGGMVVSGETYSYLKAVLHHFEVGRYGRAELQGKSRPVNVFEIRGRRVRPLDDGTEEKVPLRT
jgi:class 3 adenylate cyclase